MTEGVNVCDFFANSGAEMWSDVVATELGTFPVSLFRCNPVIVNLSSLLAFSDFHLLCKDLESIFFAVPLRSHSGQVSGGPKLSTNIPYILR